jgi:hypothetical protein
MVFFIIIVIFMIRIFYRRGTQAEGFSLGPSGKAKDKKYYYFRGS